MEKIYGFDFEQINIKRGNRGGPKKQKCVWINTKNSYLCVSGDLVEKSPFMPGDEVVLRADKKIPVFCLSPAPYKDLPGAIRFGSKFPRSNTLVINSKDLVNTIATICEAGTGHTYDLFTAWVGSDGSILFRPEVA